jgi:hypothetical protein
MAVVAVMMGRTLVMSYLLPALSWNLEKGTHHYYHAQRNIPSGDPSRCNGQHFHVWMLPDLPGPRGL